MSRLTKRDSNGVPTIPPENASLAVDKLWNFENAEEQGLLLHLPCKIGDDIYFIGGFCNYDGNEKCTFSENLCDNCPYWKNRIKTKKFSLEDLYSDTGELMNGLFVTLEEVETKLKEMEDSNE